MWSRSSLASGRTLRLAAYCSIGIIGLAAYPVALRKPPTPAPQPEKAPAVQARAPSGRLRIGLRSLNGRGAFQVKLLSSGTLTDGLTGKKLQTVAANVPLKVLVDWPTGHVLVKGPRGQALRPSLALSARLVQIGSRRYPGRVRFSVAGPGLQLVNELDIEQYLEGVLPGELPRSFGLEAQKALAVAARSYALVQRGKHGDYDLCDRTCCQMYLGYHRGSARGLAAVRATRRQCLWSNGELVYAFYSADCGGLSANVADVPLKDKPARPLAYLRRVKDAPRGGPYYCGSSPYHTWSRRLTLQQIEDRLNARPETYIGDLAHLRVTEYDPSGRVKTVVLQGHTPRAGGDVVPVAAEEPVERTISGWELRKAVGALTLKSTRMRIDEPQPGLYRFIGNGFGHGLGLCQIGANGMAKRGLKYRQILAHYYPGTQVRALPR
jgi:stage II sporulation protein D (peptidoglycan lytic transglycosylase)